MIHISAEVYVKDVANLAKQIDASKYKNIYGIPTGGGMVALELSRLLGIPVADKPGPGTLIVDDLIDSGRTLEAYPNHDSAVIYRKPNSPKLETYCSREVDGWIVFFYDKQDYGLEDNVVRILQSFGEDPAREGLRDTPKQYLQLLNNFLNPGEFKLKTTKTNSTKPVKYADIPFVSLCECHIMPILGTVTVEFTPNGLTASYEDLEKFIKNQTRKIVDVDSLKSEIKNVVKSGLKAKNAKFKMYPRKTCQKLI